MKRKKMAHTEEFKRDAIRLLESRGSKTVPEIATSIGVSQSMLYRWRELYGAASSGHAVTAENTRDEVESLRRRLRELEQENTILKKATALFARDVK